MIRYGAGESGFVVRALCAPGGPEDFLYRGTRNGDQLDIINAIKNTGANCTYFQAVRSDGGDGNSTHNPFVDSDASKGLDQDILDQWETWFTESSRPHQPDDAASRRLARRDPPEVQTEAGEV